MSDCLISQRVQEVSQCGTYRLYLFSEDLGDVNVIITNVARERGMFKVYEPSLITIDGTGISYVDILYDDFGEFLNSASDFEIRTERYFDPVLIYLGLDSDSEQILASSITAKFNELYNADNEKEQIALQIFKI